MIKKTAISLILVICLVIVGLPSSLDWWGKRPLSLTSSVVTATVKPGSTATQVAKLWVESGVQTSPWLLAFWFRYSGDARSIRAGTYEVSSGVTPLVLLEKMIKGQEAVASIRFLEGWTFKQVRAALAGAEHLQKNSIRMSDEQIMQAVGAPQGQYPEGQFFPSTYVYPKGSDDIGVLKMAYRNMQQQLHQAWESKSNNTAIQNKNELLILASIIEKETNHEKDRGLISGVFNNRLQKRMLLQTDPTVIYGLGDGFDGNLRKRDLQNDTPYNTYTRIGLPPTPISLPGRSSLFAAVQPELTKALYFVAKGDGTSEFSETLAEHNKAVNKYQRGR